jgi:peptide/nickel transport system ATP-binding protein
VSQVLRSGKASNLERSPETLVKVSDLHVSFSHQFSFFGSSRSKIHAVDGVSFEIYKSEIFSLVGESGSGKTTTARCIMKNTNPISGSILYDNLDVINLTGKQLLEYRKQVQMIYQDPYESLNPRQNVMATISIPIRRLLGETDEHKIRETVFGLLSEVGLPPDSFINKLPHQLSGGERQRVNIARALAPSPSLLLADEPLTMLDASQRLNILSLLLRIKSKRDLTILLITHDLASAKVMSDRTAIMQKGKIVEIGPTSEVLTQPKNEYTQLILSSTPRLKRSTNANS